MEIDRGFEEKLVTALEPINQAFTAFVLYTLIESGLADVLSSGPQTVAELARLSGLPDERVSAVVDYLANERYVVRSGSLISLSQKGVDVVQFEPWYRLLIGGYGVTLTQLPTLVADSAAYGVRNVAEVARGSCGISRFDAIPLLRHLLADGFMTPTRIVDIGCGDGTFLLSVMESIPVEHGLGLDVDPHAVAVAQRNAAASPLLEKVEFRVTDAVSYIKTLQPAGNTESTCFIASFVLQEILQQAGRPAVLEILRAIADHSKGSCLVVIEVEPSPPSAIMESGLGKAYYNPESCMLRVRHALR